MIMDEERPILITIISILMLVTGVLNLFIGGVSLLQLDIFIMFFIGIFYIGVGIAQIFLGWGLWLLKEWARKLTIFLFFIILLQSIVSIIFLKNYLNVFNFIYLILIYYLNRDDVKEVFQITKKEGFVEDIIGFFKNCIRVLKILTKPDWKEFSAATKVTGLGILLIGFIGFIIFLIWNIMKMVI